MSEEDAERWGRDSGQGRPRSNDPYPSPTNSAFEMMDPHDPVLSRLATLLFEKTNQYLQSEMAAGQEHYVLLEEINRLAITKYTDLRNLAANLNRSFGEYKDIYTNCIQPLLIKIEEIDQMVTKLEENAYRIDHYTKQLRNRLREADELNAK